MIKSQLHQNHWMLMPQVSLFLWFMTSILYCPSFSFFFLHYDEHRYIYMVWKSAETEHRTCSFLNPITGKGLDKYKISLLYVSLLLCMCSVGSVVSNSLWLHGLQPARLLIHGILQARTLEWVAMPSSWGSSQPRGQTHFSYLSCMAGSFFTTSTSWKTHLNLKQQILIPLKHLGFHN